MSRTAISIKGLNKAFRQQTVLQDINLDIQAGSYVGLVGKNGAGKTTLIKSILDFISVDSGTIRLFDVPHTDRQSRACLSFLPEKFLPPYYLTGRDFLHYMAELQGREFSDTEIREMLNILDLDETALNKSVRQYSKGMAQKLGLAACLLSQRKMLIFDEPMSGLDPIARARLKQYLLDLKSAGMTFFFSTHQLADIEVLCDHLVILDNAQIRFSGTPAACYQQYQVADIEQAYLACIGA